MSTLATTINSIRLWDELSLRDIWINRINPLVKLFLTIGFILCVASFNKYEVVPLIVFFLYPSILIVLSEIPLILFLKKLLPLIPFVFFLSIVNIFFDPLGIVLFFFFFLRSILCFSAAFMFSATTNIFTLSDELQDLGVPCNFTMIITLFFRYILVLLEETATMIRAYKMRSLDDKGLAFTFSGPFLGQLLIRTLNRSEKIYAAISLRSTSCKNNAKAKLNISKSDFLFLALWIIVFLFLRVYRLENIVSFYLLRIFHA